MAANGAIKPGFGIGRALLALALLAGPGHAVARTVVVYGDSITMGGELPVGERTKVWVQRVAQLSGGRLSMHNEGRGGRWTDSLSEFDSMLERQRHTDVLVLALGTNDSQNDAWLMVSRAVANLRAMIERARRAWGSGLAVVIVGPPQLRVDRYPPGAGEARNRRLQALGAAFAELAHQTGSRFVSLYGVLPEASLAGDGLHPDVSGHEAIARAMLPVLLEAAAP